jgi:hypothetical protein
MLTCPHGLPYECPCNACLKEALERERQKREAETKPEPERAA